MSKISSKVLKSVVDAALTAVTKTMEKPPKKKANKKKKKTKNNETGITTKVARAAFGYQVAIKSFTISSVPQKNVGVDSSGGLRISGNSLFSANCTGNSANVKALLIGATYYDWVPLTSVYLDRRLQTFFYTYDSFAFRYIRVTYMPACSTTVAKSLAFGLTGDYTNTYDTPTNSQQSVLEMPGAVLTTIWASAYVERTYDGTDVYNTSSDTHNEQSQRYQMVLGAAVEATSGASTFYGQFMIEYVIDMYEPSIYKANINTPAPAGPDDPSHSTDSIPPLPISRTLSKSSSSSSFRRS